MSKNKKDKNQRNESSSHSVEIGKDESSRKAKGSRQNVRDEERKGKGAPFRLMRGYGTIRYIGPGRTRPYAVHPPARRMGEGNKTGYRREKALCYVSNWYTGFAVLTAWHAGTWYPGMELDLPWRRGAWEGINRENLRKGDLDVTKENALGYERMADSKGDNARRGTRKSVSSAEEKNANVFPESPQNAEEWKQYCDYLQRICLGKQGNFHHQIEHQQIEHPQIVHPQIEHPRQNAPSAARPKAYTVREVYERFYESKFGAEAPKRLSASTARNMRVIFRKLEAIEDRTMDSLTVDELQEVVNRVQRKRATVSKTALLIRELYRYALSRELCSRNPAQYVKMPDTPDYVHHQDFSDEELAVLWRHQGDPVIKMILLMCYTGFRISAYQTLELNLKEQYFRGGVKTKAGKNRIVPIHSAILPIAKEWQDSGKPYLCTINKTWFARCMKRKLQEIGIDQGERHHSPHSCRHTFSRLCESYGVREADRKRLLGHSFGNDLTNGVYGHRSVAELRAEIEKIQIIEFTHCLC